MITIIEPYGFCFGVTNSIAKVLNLRKACPRAAIYFLKPLVHNRLTDKAIRAKARARVYDCAADPKAYASAYMIMPAHGYTKNDLALIKSLRANPIDCTCPVLLNARARMLKDLAVGYDVYFVGKTNHPESLSVIDADPRIRFIPAEQAGSFDFSVFAASPRLAIYPQSTLGRDFFLAFVGKARGYAAGSFKTGSICGQCLDRWKAVESVCPRPGASFIVVGDRSSSNSDELLGIVRKAFAGHPSFLIEGQADLALIRPRLDLTKDIYVCSATSAPSRLVRKTAAALRRRAFLAMISSPLRAIRKKS